MNGMKVMGLPLVRKTLKTAIFLFALGAVKQLASACDGPACPFPEPLNHPASYPINFTLDPMLRLDPGSKISNLVIEGASTLRYEININILTLVMTFELTLQQASVSCAYSATGHIDLSPITEETVPRGDIKGSGTATVDAKGVQVKGKATLTVNQITNKVTAKILNFEVLEFESLSIDLGANITIGGKTPDWDSFNANLKTNFDRDVNQQINELTENVRKSANGLIGQYDLSEFMDRIDEICGAGCD